MRALASMMVVTFVFACIGIVVFTIEAIVWLAGCVRWIWS